MTCPLATVKCLRYDAVSVARAPHDCWRNHSSRELSCCVARAAQGEALAAVYVYWKGEGASTFPCFRVNNVT